MSLINTAYKFTNLVSNCVFSLFVIEKNINVFSDEIKILESHINREVLNTQNETQSNLVLDAIYGIIVTVINIFAKDKHHLRVVSISIFEFIKKYMNFLGHNLELDKLVNLEYGVHMYILILIPIILINKFQRCIKYGEHLLNELKLSIESKRSSILKPSNVNSLT